MANTKRGFIKRGCKLFTLTLSMKFSLCGYKKKLRIYPDYLRNFPCYRVAI